MDTDSKNDAERIRDLAHEIVAKHEGRWAFELLRVAMFREAYDSGFNCKLRLTRMSAKERAALIPLRKNVKPRDDMPAPLESKRRKS